MSRAAAFRCFVGFLLTLESAQPGFGQAFSIFEDGFESGGQCAWSGGSSPQDCPPVFPGLTLVAATDDTEITLAWMPAIDDSTPAGQMLYRVHLSTAADFEPTPTTLAATVTGGTDLFNQWQDGTYANLGIELRPASNNNRFNVFRSSDYTLDIAERPKLVVVE